MNYFGASTGKKFLMAISGLALFGFILAHLIGNLQVYLGPEDLNRYSAFLHSTGELLWVARGGLLAMVILHIWTATALTLENRAARPTGYAAKDYIEASYASRTMHWSGILVAAYIIYHLMHFTFRSVHPEFGHFIDAQGRPDVYRMVVSSFQQPSIALTYILANFLLGMHLSHGVYSAFQSLGLLTDEWRSKIRLLSCAVGYGIFLGYASIPLGVMLGWVAIPWH
jgi:succinate dehydrogenase / fumarate reductase cytochrome b subunit